MLSIFHFLNHFGYDIGSHLCQLKKRHRGMYFVGCPKFGKTFSWKTRLTVLGTVAQIFPAFWHANVHFLARSFWHIFIFIMFESIYDVMQCVPKKFRKLPSARRFFPKVFRRSHFWTSNSCPFPENFFESCANSFRNITNLFM